jgi:hypothetical protein
VKARNSKEASVFHRCYDIFISLISPNIRIKYRPEEPPSLSDNLEEVKELEHH